MGNDHLTCCPIALYYIISLAPPHTHTHTHTHTPHAFPLLATHAMHLLSPLTSPLWFTPKLTVTCLSCSVQKSACPSYLLRTISPYGTCRCWGSKVQDQTGATHSLSYFFLLASLFFYITLWTFPPIPCLVPWHSSILLSQIILLNLLFNISKIRWFVSINCCTMYHYLNSLLLFHCFFLWFRWGYLVVDEAHRLKNRASVLFDSLGRVGARRRLLLTGTPLQNNLGGFLFTFLLSFLHPFIHSGFFLLAELWSLFSFVLPDIFDDLEQFTGWFSSPFENNDSASDDDCGNLLFWLCKYYQRYSCHSGCS